MSHLGGLLKPFFSGTRAAPAAPPTSRPIEAFGFSTAAPTVATRLQQESVQAAAAPRERFCPSECARIAVYDGAGSAPRVEEVAIADTGEYIALLASRTYELARAMGGRVPFSVINEVVENYIHADFRGPVVTILDSGNTIRFSDQGPGIKEKDKVLEPGFTTASAPMKRYIRGVGSGLPLVRECLSFSEGTVEVEDNLGCGAVVTVTVAGVEGRARAPGAPESASAGVASAIASASAGSAPPATSAQPDGSAAGSTSADSFVLEPTTYPAHGGTSRLTNRQKRVLALVMDAGQAGPSLVARELAIGLSTAYRDLAHLEVLGFIVADESGKRSLTPEGSAFLHSLLHPGR